MQRSRATSALDWLALALVIVAAAIALTGGLSIRFAGSRVTARSPDRVALVALAVVALRVSIDRRTRPLASAPPLFRRIRNRVYNRAQELKASLAAFVLIPRCLAAALVWAIAFRRLTAQIGHDSTAEPAELPRRRRLAPRELRAISAKMAPSATRIHGDNIAGRLCFGFLRKRSSWKHGRSLQEPS